MRARVSIIIFVFLFSTQFPTCKKNKQRIVRPPELNDFVFGGSRKENNGVLIQQGWNLLRENKNSVEFVWPVEIPEELKRQSLDAKSSVIDQIILLFENEQLNIVRIIHRDTAKNMNRYVANLNMDYDLTQPSWSATPTDESTATGNRITQEMDLYETEDFIFKIFRTSFHVVEKDMQGGLNDKIECLIFARQQNPGISLEGLREKL